MPVIARRIAYLCNYEATCTPSKTGARLAPTLYSQGLFNPFCRIMKRKASSNDSSPRAKKQPAVQLPDYCDVIMRKAENGQDLWPADPERLKTARNFIREWYFPELEP